MHNTKLSLIYKNGEYVIQDSMGNIIINDIHDVDVLTYENYSLFRFFTNEGEFSCITSSGFFFREYSYLDYDAVSKLIDSKYKIKKANKFGILDCGTNKIDQECVYDEVRALASNDFMYGASVKIKHNKKYGNDIHVYTTCHSERQRRICIKMLHFVQHDSQEMIT